MFRPNPFIPGRIAVADLFAGRQDALKRLTGLIRQVPYSISNFAIVGERGIGKSSLLEQVKIDAENGLAGDPGEIRFLTMSVALDQQDDFASIIGKIGVEFAERVDDLNLTKKLAKIAWDFLTKWEFLGVKFNREAGERPRWQLINDLAKVISSVERALVDSHAGVLCFIDEADQPAEEAGLGMIIKRLVEQLTRSSEKRVGFGLAGLPPLTDRVLASHGSALRPFQVFSLKPLAEEECRSLLRCGMELACRTCPSSISMDTGAENWIVENCEGYPHFLQQYAYAAFDANDDDTVDLKDVFNGAFREHGALDQLAFSYFKGMFGGESVSDLERRILLVLAPRYEALMSRDEICAELDAEEDVDVAVERLLSRGTILHDPVATKQFRIASNSFASWIRMRIRKQAG